MKHGRRNQPGEGGARKVAGRGAKAARQPTGGGAGSTRPKPPKGANKKSSQSTERRAVRKRNKL